MAMPLTFGNSFWSPAFDTSALFTKLQAGCVENTEVLQLVKDRAAAARQLATSLDDIAYTKFDKAGFAKDDGAGLRRTIEGLKHESAAVAKAHETVARNLETMIIYPFSTWTAQHERRISDLREDLADLVTEWENLSIEVRKLKDTRNTKCAQADDAEEDLRFAPASSPETSKLDASPQARGRSDSSTSSNAAAASSQAFAAASATASQAAHQAAQAAQTATTAASNLARTFSQRIKISPTAAAVKTRFDRMRTEASERDMASRGKDAALTENLEDEEGKQVAAGEKQAIVSQMPASTPHAGSDQLIDQLEIAGITKHPKDWSIIFAKAKAAVPTTAVKVPLIGTTPDAHSGEDLVLWFRENLEDIGFSLSRAHELCRQLSEELSILRLVGEFGNKFIDSSDAFYAWRPEAFQLDKVQDQINAAAALQKSESSSETLTQLPRSYKDRKANGQQALGAAVRLSSPTLPAVPEDSDKRPVNGSSVPTSPSRLSRSGAIGSYLTSAYEVAASNVTSLNARIAKANASPVDGKANRLRKEADDAELAYRVGIKELDELRMMLEQRVASSLNRAQKLELDRLKALKSVISTFNNTLASLNTPLQLSSERSALLQETYQPMSELNSITERYRTGPFRPRPNVWVDFYHEQTDVRFGLDLRHWRDTHDKMEELPDVVRELLSALKDGYEKLANDEERRRTWVYEVPLQYTHKMRNIVNNAHGALPVGEVRKFDLPVQASVLKLWLLELAVPLVPFNAYSDVKAIYPAVGAEQVDDDKRVAELSALLERLPKIHLAVLNAVLAHLITLTDTTSAGDDKADYYTKLGATLGPCVLRPAYDSPKTLEDRFPMLLFVDLLKHYERLLPSALEKKSKVEEERYAPKRQRTKMVDQRVSRSRMQGSQPDERQQQQLLKEEMGRKTGSRVVSAEPDEMPSQKDERPSLPVKDKSKGSMHSISLMDGAQQSDGAAELQAPTEAPQAEAVATAAASPSVQSAGIQSELDAEIAAAALQPIARTDSNDDAADQPFVDAAQEPASETYGAPTDALDEEEEDLDRPLYSATETNFSRVGSNVSAKRLQRASGVAAGSTSNQTGRPARGPRPMSVHAGGIPSAVSGSSPLSANSPTGSPLPAGSGGVRARAAMFEQRGDVSPSGAHAKGHRVTASTSDISTGK